MNKESKLNLNAGDYAISHCDSDKTYNGLEVHRMLCDAYIAGNNDTLDDEDEKIRHYLMNFVKINDGVNLPPDYAKKALAWLEKQKDCIKLSDSAYTSNRDVIEFADKYSHAIWEKLMDKFKKNENYSIGCNDVSDIVLNAIINTYNWLEKQGSKDKFIEKELGCIKGYREKAIKRLEELEKQDEKDILKDAILDGYILDDDKDGLIAETIRYKNEKQSEQKFEMKTAEESLGIGSDTYNKIVDECIFGEQKPVEENKGNFGGISPNWSEEDKDFMYDTLSNLTELKDRYGEGYGNVGKCIDWLKSLRPQSRWKPSDEQISLLQAIINEPNNAASESCQIVLKDILEQLKKLKKE